MQRRRILSFCTLYMQLDMKRKESNNKIVRPSPHSCIFLILNYHKRHAVPIVCTSPMYKDVNCHNEQKLNYRETTIFHRMYGLGVLFSVSFLHILSCLFFRGANIWAQEGREWKVEKAPQRGISQSVWFI